MIYVKETEYEIMNIKNYQERYLVLPSWKEYLECFFNHVYKTSPDVSMPKTFQLLVSNLTKEHLMGYFYLDLIGGKGDKYFVHIAEVIDKEDIPYDVYINKVKIERYPMDLTTNLI